MKLTDKELEELRHIDYRNRGASGIRHGAMTEANNPRVASNLCRKGLVKAFYQSESVRGERRRHYRLYSMTDAGREALACSQSEGANG